MRSKTIFSTRGAHKSLIHLFCFLMCVALLCPASLAPAAGPPEEPILRIESGMHTAAIRRIDTGPQGETLLTCSDDKTLRLWDLDSGELRKTLRVPMDRAEDGELYSCVLSPDGETIATGGWTGYNWDKEYSIYLLDPSSVRITDRISGLPYGIAHLAFSPDGRYLAATLGSDNGLRVYRTADWSLAAKDTDYGDASYWTDFGPEGRLVTVSLDGHVRLYNQDFVLVADEEAPGGEEPCSCAFSPDGERIAVGFGDSTRVNVLSGRNLEHLYSPDTNGVDNGSLNSVAWSADGSTLYAGGVYSYENGNNPVLAWPDQGRGEPRGFSASDTTIMHIHPLPKDGVVYGAYDPAWGVVRSGERKFYKQPVTADYRGPNEDEFQISDSGNTVFFGFEYGEDRPAVYSVNERSLRLGSPETDLEPPLLETEDIHVTNWKHTEHPELNGRELDLEDYEDSRSLAVAPDGDRFVLGAEWHIYCFDEEGDRVWTTPVPGAAWGVNIARDRNVVVAALGDGTIRWYRLKDGREILALFPHKDGESWVLWTPEGYYAASPEGDELIGWHKNRGRDRAPDFFPASRFRSVYYRPDVTQKVLTTLDVDKALELANKQAGRKKKKASVEEMLPPVVDILSPSDGAGFEEPRVTLRYLIRTPNNEKVTGVRFMVDGRPVKRKQRGIKVVSQEGTSKSSRITLPKRDCKVSVIAKNRYSASSPASISLNWQGRGKSSRDEFEIKPKLYLLSIGVSDYEKERLELRYPANDARDVARVFSSQEGRLYREVESRVLADADWGTVLDGLDWMEKEVTSNDVAAVFLAGHGYNDRDGDYYFLPANADPNKLRRTCVPYSMIKDVVNGLPGKTLFFVDTCYSGNVFGSERRSGLNNINRIVNDLSSAENGVVVFASSTGEQFSIEDEAWKNGAFTEALVEGLSGKADYTGRKAITINELDLYLAERVKELTDGKQTPTVAKPETVPDFPIAIMK